MIVVVITAHAVATRTTWKTIAIRFQRIFNSSQVPPSARWGALKSRVFTLIYIAIAIASLVYFGAITLNYVQFYPALDKLAVQAEGQQIFRDSQNIPTQVLVQLRVTNPTSYSGLRLEYLVVHLYFSTTANDSATLFQNFALLGSNSTIAPLGPGTSLRLQAVLPLAGNQSSLLANFLGKYGTSVVSDYNVEIHLFTFLDALVPTLEVVRDIQYTNG